MCSECKRLDKLVQQAEGNLAYAAREIKCLDLMTYSEVSAWEQRSAPLRRELISAKSNRTRHRNKCGVRP